MPSGEIGRERPYPRGFSDLKPYEKRAAIQRQLVADYYSHHAVGLYLGKYLGTPTGPLLYQPSDSPPRTPVHDYSILNAEEKCFLYYQKLKPRTNHHNTAKEFRRIFDKELTIPYITQFYSSKYGKDPILKYHLLKMKYDWIPFGEAINIVKLAAARERVAKKKKDYRNATKELAPKRRMNELPPSRRSPDIKVENEDD